MSLIKNETSTELLLRTESSLFAAQNLINKSYLSQLDKFELVSIDNQQLLNTGGDVRIFQVERLALDNKQSVLESTAAAYTALGAAGYSVFLFLDSNGSETFLYIGTRCESGAMLGSNSGELLQETFKGHFSGSQLNSLNGKEVEKLLGKLSEAESNSATSITAVTSVPSLSTDNQEHFMQGLEKFIDAAENRVYQGVILAEPVTAQILDKIKIGFEQVSTQLSALSKRQYSYGIQDSDTVSRSISHSLTESLGESLGLSESKGFSNGTSSSYSETDTTSEGSSSPDAAGKVIGMGASVVGGGLGLLFGGPIGAGFGASVGGQLGGLFASTNTEGTSHSTSESNSTTYSKTETSSESKTSSKTNAKGVTDSESLGKTQGNTQQISFDVVDKSIESLLNKIDHNLERVDKAKTFGGWNTAAYFVGEGQASSEALASLFLGLIRGQDSSSEDFALTSWKKEKTKPVLDWLGQLMHPRLTTGFASDIGIEYLTPATLVSGKEMAIQLSLPRRSTSTVMVQETKAFGRKVQLLDTFEDQHNRSLDLGCIRHLWTDLPQKVSLDIDSLASHVFVGGSTGSGKSNTIYGLLDNLAKQEIPFLVIEPAKGEYKHVFGNRDDVTVLGTNNKHTDLLRINPFSFPANTHVLEHVDRLIEIFNVCWSMSAAMPAILKKAVLQSYEQCGWDLSDSTHPNDIDYYPTFVDLLIQLKSVINYSDYSQEMKGNYTGALITRVESLINGLNGKIFGSNEVPDDELFDKNVIIDLSRVGSQETKSLIMGLLIIRLSEYRSEQALMNQPLKHVTVLEEAHNILGKSSSSNNEGSSLVDKSVEMLSNAIAEMRTYGEGFVIADQSPSAVHISAIRNTNTKIIMRLPDEQDRRLTGKSVGLSDEQIDELAKLPRGVAVVYQNNWLEAVLCKIDKWHNEECFYNFSSEHCTKWDEKAFRRSLIQWLLQPRLNRLSVVDKDILISGLTESNLSTAYKIKINQYLDESNKHQIISIQGKAKYFELSSEIVSIIGCINEIEQIVNTPGLSFRRLNSELNEVIKHNLGLLDSELNIAVQQSIMKVVSVESDKHLKQYAGWSTFIKNRG